MADVQHFDFTLENEDAQNLMRVLHNYLQDCRYQAYLKQLNDPAQAKWLEQHADYFQTIIARMAAGITQENREEIT